MEPSSPSKRKLHIVKNPLKAAEMWLETSSWRAKAILLICIIAFIGFAYWNSESISVILPLYLVSGLAKLLSMGLLIYKISKASTCEGLSLSTQGLTAVSLVLRLIMLVNFLSYRLPGHISTFQAIRGATDIGSLALTLWVVTKMRTTLSSTYLRSSETVRMSYILVPCALVALLFHRLDGDTKLTFTSFCSSAVMYIEALAVVPQIVMIHKAKAVEAITASYVFSLGIERLCSLCVTGILFIESYFSGGALYDGFDLSIIVHMCFQLVHSFILADFCYYYAKALSLGRLRLPAIRV